MISPVNNHANFHQEPGIKKGDEKISENKLNEFFSENNIYEQCTDIHCSSESHLPKNQITVEWDKTYLEFARFPFSRV